jgi:hypothetical protein
MMTNMATPINVPIHIQQEAEAQELGSLTKVYDFAFGNNLIQICLSVIFIPACFTPLFLMMKDPYFFSVMVVETLFVISLFLLIPLTLMAIAIRRIRRFSYQRTYLFQYGIIIENKGQMQTFSWSQVAEVWQHITQRSAWFHDYHLSL